MKLRKLKEKDADGMYEWMHYAETKEIFEKDFSKYEKDDILNFIKNIDKTSINLACVDVNDNYLGTVSLKNIDYNNLNAELAISFMKEAQGTGAASFALSEILKKGFKELNLKKIYLNVLKTNSRAIKFYNKFGFKKEGCFKKHIRKKDRYIDLEWYAIIDDDYNTRGV